MKFRQEFQVPASLATVWAFFEQPTRVAPCMPGLETAELLDRDTLLVRLTQSVGPLNATFESKVRITERVPLERIEFTSTGKAVRGAIGSFRTTSTVTLAEAGSATRVAVEGEAALAGMLGSVAHRVVAKQAEKVTAAFAANLERALAGGPGGAAEVGAAPAQPVGRLAAGAQTGLEEAIRRSLWWSRAATVLSAAAVGLAIVILWKIEGR